MIAAFMTQDTERWRKVIHAADVKSTDAPRRHAAKAGFSGLLGCLHSLSALGK